MVAVAPYCLYIVCRAAETVEYGPGVGMPLQHFESLCEPFAAVYYYRKTESGGLSGLNVESLHLLVGECLVPVEVYAHFAHGAVIAQMCFKFVCHGLEVAAPCVAHLGGVESHSHSGAGGSLAVQRAHRLYGGEVYIGQYHHIHAGLYGAVCGLALAAARAHVLPFDIELGHVDVGVCIYHISGCG